MSHRLKSRFARYETEEIDHAEGYAVLDLDDIAIIPLGYDEDGGRVLFCDRNAVKRRRFAPFVWRPLT
jgi:hypothetical protein